MQLKLKNIVVCIIVLAGISGNRLLGQGEGQKLEFETPRKTMLVLQYYIAEEHFKPELAAKAFKFEDPGSKSSLETVEKLKKIMVSRGLIIDPDKVPNDKNYMDSASGENRYTPFKSFSDICLKKYKDKWLVSKSSIAAIDELYDGIFRVSTDSFIQSFPPFLQMEYLGIKVWQVVGYLIYIIIGIILYKLLDIVFKRFIKYLIKKIFKSQLVAKLTDRVAHLISLTIIVVLFHVYTPLLILPIEVNFVLNIIYKLAIPLLLTLIAYRIADVAADIFDKLAARTATKMDDKLSPLIRKALKFIVIIAGLIYTLNAFDIELAPVLAGVSIGGIAIAFAAQDTIRHLFGSVTVFTDRPFEVGDWIVFEGNEGVVEEVGVRSSRIRTFYNSILTVPNGKLSDMVIDNMGRRQFRRYRTMIAVTYDTPIKVLNVFTEGLRKIILNHPKTKKDNYAVYLNDFSESSLHILFNVHIEVSELSDEFQARHELITKILALADRLNVRFAFPTRTMHMETFPQTQGLTPVYPEDENQLEAKMIEFFNESEINEVNNENK
jgi:MscS family membrane protein